LLALGAACLGAPCTHCDKRSSRIDILSQATRLYANARVVGVLTQIRWYSLFIMSEQSEADACWECGAVEDMLKLLAFAAGEVYLWWIRAAFAPPGSVHSMCTRAGKWVVCLPCCWRQCLAVSPAAVHGLAFNSWEWDSIRSEEVCFSSCGNLSARNARELVSKSWSWIMCASLHIVHNQRALRCCSACVFFACDPWRSIFLACLLIVQGEIVQNSCDVLLWFSVCALKFNTCCQVMLHFWSELT